MIRLVGLWTSAEDEHAFELEYLGSHFPRLESLPGNRGTTTARCLDGPYCRMTEIEFATVDDLNAALETPAGAEVLEQAKALATKFGVRLDVLIVPDRS